MTDPALDPAASLQAGTEKSRRGFVGRLRDLLRGGNDDDTWEQVEETLIAADLGAELTFQVVGRARARRDLVPDLALQVELIDLFAVREPVPWPRKPSATTPAVILVVGVNGTGKTTTIAKLAYRYQEPGRAGAAGRRGHVPGRRHRAAHGLGHAHRCAHHRPRRRAPIRRRSCGTRWTPPPHAARTWSSWTPPGGCTPSPT